MTEYQYETFDNNVKRVKPNVKEVNDIVSKHTVDSSVGRAYIGDDIKITLYNKEDTQDIISELAKFGYSFDVDIAFEAPIHIDVRSRINPEL